MAQLTDDPTILFQYSVTADWRGKIRQTVAQVKEHFPGAVLLYYVTNQDIRAAADSIAKEMRQKYHLPEVADDRVEPRAALEGELDLDRDPLGTGEHRVGQVG